jgi:uncharacterized protein
MMGSDSVAADLISEELQLIRKRVPGVRGSVAATGDGLLIAADVHDVEPTQIAALVAALHAVAVRAALSTESGEFRDVITRASDGYLAVFAAGRTAIVAVLGTTALNVAILNYQARMMIERVAAVSADLTRRPSPHAAPAQADPAYPDPAHPDPAHPDPAHPDPAHPDPAHPDPAHPDPGYADRAYPAPSQAPASAEDTRGGEAGTLPVRRRHR